MFSRVAYNHTLAGGKHAGEVIDLGKFVDVRDCATKCCEHANCEVAHVHKDHCYAVDCYTKDLCKSQKAKRSDGPTVLVYMNKRNEVRQKDKGKEQKARKKVYCSMRFQKIFSEAATEGCSIKKLFLLKNLLKRVSNTGVLL